MGCFGSKQSLRGDVLLSVFKALWSMTKSVLISVPSLIVLGTLGGCRDSQSYLACLTMLFLGRIQLEHIY